MVQTDTSKKTILWLASWYPTQKDPLEGDFIQRQARAAAIYHEIYLIHVHTNDYEQHPNKDLIHKQGNLTEHLSFIQPSGFPVLGTFFTWLRYFKRHRKIIKEYIKNYGIPSKVHVQVAMKSGLIAWWIKKKYKIPYVVTEHYGIYNSLVPDPFHQRSIFFKKATAFVFKHASYLLPVSTSIGKDIQKMVIDKPFTSIPNVVDTQLFYYIPPQQKVFHFIHVSNMAPLKNVEGIIIAALALWKENLPFTLELVGPIDQVYINKLLGIGLPSDILKFTGAISYEDVANAMQQSHAFILFSNTENQPCVLLESLCCGRPVIATAVGGIPEIIDDSNGILVASGNQIALANAMRTMIKEYQQYDGEKIAIAAASKFGMAAVGKKISSYY